MADLSWRRGTDVLGEARQFDPTRMHLTLEDWILTYEPLYRFSLAGKRFLVVFHHELVRHLLRERPEALRHGSG